MNKYNIYLGLLDKDTEKQEHDIQFFYNGINKILCKYNITGYTIFNTTGYYKGDNTIVVEPSLNIEIITNGILLFQKLNSIKFNLCKKFNQESVLITKQEIQVL